MRIGWHYCNSRGSYLLEIEGYWDYWEKVNNRFRTYVVATDLPNELDFYDMGRNVYEWCSDWFADYTKEDQVNPKGPETGENRCDRGGSYSHFSVEARCSHRRGITPAYNIYWGFRLAMDIIRSYEKRVKAQLSLL